MVRSIAVVDLYCGMGGFTQGAIEAGAMVILSADFWDEAVKVHKLNHPDIPCLQLKLGTPSDWKLIKKFIDKYPDYHIHLHGSPPCQALSNASTTDPSKGMFLVLHFLDLVEKLKPDSWSMENVVPMRKRLPEGTPSVVLNSADFGVPQTRRRCIAGEGWVANPSHTKEEWISVIEALPHLQEELLTHLQGYSRTRPVMDNGKHTGVNTPRIPPDGCKTLDEPSYTVCSGSMNLFSINLDGATHSNSRRARSADVQITSPSLTLRNNRPTLREFKLNMIGSGTGAITKIRSLTIAETLILQGFNPDFDLSITKTKKSRWTMVGNAVCPPVAKAIIEGIVNE